MKNIILLTTLSWSFALIAGPIYSSNCEVESRIDSPSNSNGFFMSNDCKTAYVLPPAKGTTTIIGRTAGELSRCREIFQFNKALKILDNEMNSLLSEKKSTAEIKDSIEKRKLLFEQYSNLSNTIGASLELNFSTSNYENIKNFQELNPNLDITFKAISLKNAKLAWNQTSAVNPEVRIAFNQSIPITDLNSIGSGSFNGRLDLSLIGACPLRNPFDGELPKVIKIRDVAGLITPNLTYEYEIGATYKYRAEYNLGSLAFENKKLINIWWLI